MPEALHVCPKIIFGATMVRQVLLLTSFLLRIMQDMTNHIQFCTHGEGETEAAFESRQSDSRVLNSIH
jgi:hypothetical protein